MSGAGNGEWGGGNKTRRQVYTFVLCNEIMVSSSLQVNSLGLGMEKAIDLTLDNNLSLPGTQQ